MDRDLWVRYQTLVKKFREVTSPRWPNGYCCLDVDQRGTPECCALVAAGARLYFAAVETEMLNAVHGLPPQLWHEYPDGTWDVDRDFASPGTIRSLLRNAWLSDTLESASHPTRPVLGGLEGHEVIGVVGVPACNTLIGLEHYRSAHVLLLDLWRDAVDLLGVKPYYITHDLRNDLVVL